MSPFSLACKLLCVIQNLFKIIKDQFKTAWNCLQIKFSLFFILCTNFIIMSSLVAQTVKNTTAVQETWVRFLDWKDPLEKRPATHSKILAWRIPMDRGFLGYKRLWGHRVGHNQATKHSTAWLSWLVCKTVLSSEPWDLEDQSLSHNGGVKLKYLSK